MKHVVITDGCLTSRGRLVKNSLVRLVDSEADALIRLGEAKPYKPKAAAKKPEGDKPEGDKPPEAKEPADKPKPTAKKKPTK